MSAFYRIVQIVECVVCEESDLGTNVIVGFFFLNIFGLVLVNLGTMGLACASESMRATVVAIGDPGIIPNILSSGVVFKWLGTGSSSSDVDGSSGNWGYKLGVFSTICRIQIITQLVT